MKMANKDSLESMLKEFARHIRFGPALNYERNLDEIVEAITTDIVELTLQIKEETDDVSSM